MKKFIWKGLLNEKNQSGTIEAPDTSIAMILLADKNVSNIQLYPLKKTKLTQVDYYCLLSELSDLLNANVSLMDAINIVSSTHEKFFSLCHTLETLLNDGYSFTQAIQECKLYDTTVCALIHTGEQTGQLPVILEKIIGQYKQQQSILKNIKKALIYPMFVLITALTVLLAMLLFIIPKFSSLYQQFNTKLPLLTHGILALSTVLRTHGIFIVCALMFIMILLTLLIKHNKAMLIESVLYIPYLNTLLADSFYARIFFLLNTCLTSGLPMSQALTLTTHSIPFKRYQIAFNHSVSQLNAGAAFSECLDQKIFPEKIRQWIMIAENSGNLDTTCKTIGDHYSNILNEKAEKISLLIEPVMMVVLGLCIGGVVVALYLPLFQLGLAM